MAVILVVENGEGLATANSYVSLSEVQTYMANTLVESSKTDDELKADIIKACNYLEINASKFQGRIKTLEQALSWPRTGVKIQGLDLPDTSIPMNLKKAQISVFLAILDGFNPTPNINVSEMIIKDKTDVLETTYANPVDAGYQTILTEADGFLQPLYSPFGGGLAFKTVRV
jgi:hypothetical protein